MDAKLVVVGGEVKAGEVKIKKLPAVVGRSDDADIRLRHPLVSRKHCEIFEADGLLKVRDLGSLNGTFIASAKIKEAVLKPDELITIGPVVFRAVYEGPATIDDDDEFNFDLDDASDVSETQPMDITKTASIRETVAADDMSLDDFDIEVDDDTPAVEASGAEAPVAEAKGDDDFGDLDFDIDLDDDAPTAEAKGGKAAAKEAASDDADFGDLDIEFDLDDDKDDDKPAAKADKPAAKAKGQSKPDATVDEDDDEFADLLSVDDAEFDIDLDDEPVKAESKPKPAAKANDDEVEFDIDDALGGDDEELDDFLKDIGMEK